MKKALSLIISIILALSISAVFVGCETPCEHTWNDGVITTAPSLVDGQKVDGVKTFTCMQCSATKTESVQYLGFVNATEFVDALAFSNFANGIVTEETIHNYTVTATSSVEVMPGMTYEITVTAVANDMNEKITLTFADGKLCETYEEEGGLTTTTTVNGVTTETAVTKPATNTTYYSGNEVGEEFQDTFFSELAGDNFDFEDFEYDANSNEYSLKQTVETDNGDYTAITLQFENGKITSYNVEIAYDNVQIGTTTVSGSVTYGNAESIIEKYHITVFKPDGTKINGLTEGWGYNPITESETVITVQYCALDDEDNQIACTADVIVLGEDGMIAIDKESVDRFMSSNGGAKLKFQINGINTDLYEDNDLYAYINDENPYSLNFYLESIPQA